jgi:hypothetical protein
MAGLIDVNLRPDDRTLRHFGFIALAGFGLLAVLAWYELAIFAFGLGSWREEVAGTLAVLGAVALLTSLLFPRGNLPLYLALTVIAFPIGFVLSYVIMGTLFYLIIAPIGLMMRAFGRDPLNRAFLPGASSYWVDARPARPKESYFRQF